MDRLLKCMAPNLRNLFHSVLDWDKVEEIRLRVNQPLVIKEQQKEYGLNAAGRCRPSEGFRVNADDIARTVEIMAENSWYALEDEIRAGYLTLAGGHRVGICGRVVLENGLIKTIKYINGLHIRLAREVPGAADQVMPQIVRSGRIISTLIVSPPGCGKTTLLRDISRQLSNRGFNVVVIDERSEIAACHHGVPQLDVGWSAYVLDGCPKAQGIAMVLRGMAPQVIITDEIGHPNDGLALADAARAGVQVIATCHGSAWDSVRERAWMRHGGAAFQQVILLSRRSGPGTIEQVLKLD
ncbi:MAG TPA: stage III sporulation protein AA [Limnochordia bacterium]|jgi:stage III sporulation protein AA|nr:stage III sporulation protein AA [Bacillota bacterium]HOB08070.1 stage III sporulation protein AA [Limnochordia bacterium]HPT92457.1 stage III sporulation protein AA [Limnochordia bacterium]HPZ30235.1 stage III sporulation protein AA [Limnochordia bacterium]HQD70213.1 stage III sporulation protein AA [Limnochordia bacterium]